MNMGFEVDFIMNVVFRSNDSLSFSPAVTDNYRNEDVDSLCLDN